MEGGSHTGHELAERHVSLLQGALMPHASNSEDPAQVSLQQEGQVVQVLGHHIRHAQASCTTAQGSTGDSKHKLCLSICSKLAWRLLAYQVPF